MFSVLKKLEYISNVVQPIKFWTENNTLKNASWSETKHVFFALQKGNQENFIIYSYWR